MSIESSDSEFEFANQAFTDSDLKSTSNLEQATAVGLWDTSVTDDGFREIIRAKELSEISIRSDILTDAIFEVLAQLPKLRSLLIHSGPRIGDQGLLHLSEARELSELYLRETAISDRGLLSIHRLSQMWSLVLDDTAVSDEGCAVFAQMPRLRILSLSRTCVTGATLTYLCNNEHFNLYLEGTPVKDETVIAIARRLSNLKLISLNQTNVGDESAYALSKLTRLDDVRLSHTKLTDKGFAAFSGHPCLGIIYIEGCAVTQNAVNSLKEESQRQITVYGP